MQKAFTGSLCSLVFACVQPALAADFHPLESLSLPGGIHAYDNIVIPAGVTLSFEGEDRQTTLRAFDTLSLAGSLIAPGWRITLEAQRLDVTGRIVVGGEVGASGSITVIAGRGIENERPQRSPPSGASGSVSIVAGGAIGLGGGYVMPTSVPPPGDFTVGGSIVIQGSGGLIVTSDAANGNTLEIQTPVPEPEAWAMLLAGLGLVGFAARRRAPWA